jgi:hypothetical protein
MSVLALVSCWGSVAMAQSIGAEPSTGTLIGYGVMAAIAITPTVGLLLKLGRDVGRYEAKQEHLTLQLGTIAAQLQASVNDRRGEHAAFITEVQRTREAAQRDGIEMRTELREAMDRIAAQMMPREMSVLQLQNLTTKIEADVLRGLLKELRSDHGKIPTAQGG